MLIPSRLCSKEIIDVLGLKQKYIKRLTIDLDADSLVFCRVEFYPDESQVEAIKGALETVVSRYGLTELNSPYEHEPECSD